MEIVLEWGVRLYDNDNILLFYDAKVFKKDTVTDRYYIVKAD